MQQPGGRARVCRCVMVIAVAAFLAGCGSSTPTGSNAASSGTTPRATHEAIPTSGRSETPDEEKLEELKTENQEHAEERKNEGEEHEEHLEELKKEQESTKEEVEAAKEH